MDADSKFKLYEKVHEEWKDRPDKTTPCYGKDLMHIEQGIYDNSANIKKMSDDSITADDIPTYDEVMDLLNEEVDEE